MKALTHCWPKTICLKEESMFKLVIFLGTLCTKSMHECMNGENADTLSFPMISDVV